MFSNKNVLSRATLIIGIWGGMALFNASHAANYSYKVPFEGDFVSAHEEAIKNNLPNVTDDAKLVLSFGHEVHLVEGDKLNFKITTFDDLMMLKALLKIGKTEVL